MKMGAGMTVYLTLSGRAPALDPRLRGIDGSPLHYPAVLPPCSRTDAGMTVSLTLSGRAPALDPGLRENDLIFPEQYLFS